MYHFSNHNFNLENISNTKRKLGVHFYSPYRNWLLKEKRICFFQYFLILFCKYEELQLWKKLKIYIHMYIFKSFTDIVYFLRGIFWVLVLFSDWLIQVWLIFKWKPISFSPHLINFSSYKILIFVCGLMLWVLQILFFIARLFHFVISLVLNIYNYCVIINKNI